MRNHILIAMALLVAPMTASWADGKAPVAGYSVGKTLDNVTEYTLDSNGLTVLVAPRHSAPVVTFQVTYRVGSRNEGLGTTGNTHLLEHLMFKGSKNFDKANGTSVDMYLDRAGASFNATTSNDRTNYFATLGKESLEGYIAIEADRMRNLLLRAEDLASEMTVVRNEFERAEDDPGQVLNREMTAMVYMAHPYHHPIIGWQEDIEQVKVDRLRDFYNTYYWPNNATLSVVGDVDPANVLELIKKYYGAIPKSPQPIPVVSTPEPKQLGARRLEVRRAGESGIVSVAFRGPDAKSEDMPAVMMMGLVLSQGEGSPLRRALVHKSLAMDATAQGYPMHDPGMFTITAALLPGVKQATVEKIILDQVKAIQTKAVSAADLKRVLAPYKAERIYAQDGTDGYANLLNEGAALGDWTYYITMLDRLDKVTPADVQRVAKKYLVQDQSTTGWFVPTEKKQ